VLNDSLKSGQLRPALIQVMIFLSIHGFSLVDNEANEVISLQLGVKVSVLGIVELSIDQFISILLELNSLSETRAGSSTCSS